MRMITYILCKVEIDIGIKDVKLLQMMENKLLLKVGKTSLLRVLEVFNYQKQSKKLSKKLQF